MRTNEEFWKWMDSKATELHVGEQERQAQVEEALDASTFEAQVLTLPSFVYSARLREASAQRDLELAQAQTKIIEAWAEHFAVKAVAEAFALGNIDGKNADQRKSQVEEAKMGSEDYLSTKANAESLAERLPGLQFALDVAKAHRRYLEDRQSALAYILRWRETEVRK